MEQTVCNNQSNTPGEVMKAAVLSTDNLSVAWDEHGAVTSVILQGKECFVDSPSGFIITDMANDKAYTFQAALVGDAEKKQVGAVENADIHMDVTYRQEGHAIYVEGTITDTSATDRLIRLEYLLPVSAEGLYWYDDIATKQAVEADNDYSRPAEHYVQGHKMSLYPYGTVSNGKQAVAFGVPMALPQSFLIGYKTVNGAQAMYVSYDAVLTSKTEKMVSKADFSFVIYAPTQPEWGFRSASQDYYDLFPASFEVKSHGGGNWLFQHAYDQVEGVGDFYFGYNETPGSYAFDDKNGVTSLQYTAPAEQWMEWPGMPKEPEPTYEQYMGRFETLLNDTSGAMEPGFPAVTQKNAAEAMKNSAILLESGKYFTLGWYAYGVTVCFITNHNPEIPGWNSFKLQISNIERAEKNATAENTRLGGVYIDNLAGLGGYYNYREEHMRYADIPLLWDVNSKRVALPPYNGTYSYTKGIRDRCDANNQIVFANMVFPERGIAQYIHMVDVPGSECGPHWGWDPHIQRLRRTMTYRKPWLLLLGHDLGNTGNWGASEAAYESKENIMKSSIAYGLFANVIGYRVPLTEYEISRPLFRKYTYTAVVQDKLGWNPITYAAADGNGSVDCERFGDPSTGAAIFTCYNTGAQDTAFNGTMTIDLGALKVSDARAKELVAYDMINNVYVPTRIENGNLVYDVALAQQDVLAVMVGTKEELFGWMFERIKTTIQRGDAAVVRINKGLSESETVVPKPWLELEAALANVSSFKNKTCAEALEEMDTLFAGMSAVMAVADNAIDVMPSFAELLNIDVKNIYGDACAILGGLSNADI